MHQAHAPSRLLLFGPAAALAAVAVLYFIWPTSTTPAGRPPAVASRHAPAPTPTPTPTPSVWPDRGALAGLRTVRQMAGRQARDVVSAGARCLRRHRPHDQGGLRACVFRPLAAAGAARGVNGLMLNAIARHLAPGRCAKLVLAYRGLVMEMGVISDETLRTSDGWRPQRLAVRAAAALAFVVGKATTAPAWHAACRLRHPRQLAA
jgi:hypothetical protein